MPDPTHHRVHVYPGQTKFIEGSYRPQLVFDILVVYEYRESRAEEEIIWV